MTGFLERMRLRRRLRDFSPLDERVHEGARVQVTGTIRALGEILSAPISARPCVAFVARARGYTSIGGKLTGTDWHETFELARFAIERDAGPPILVEGSHAVLAVSQRARAARQPERETRFLARHAIHLGGARFHEILVEPGRRVTVGGTLVLVPAATPAMSERGFRDDMPMQPQLSGNREQPLVIVSHG